MRHWRSQLECSMRPVTVVMIDVDAEHLLELSPADDQDPVETVTSDGADPALGKRVRFRGLEGCADHFNTLAAEDFSKPCVNLLSRSWMRRRIGVGRSESDQASWRAPAELSTFRPVLRCNRFDSRATAPAGIYTLPLPDALPILT